MPLFALALVSASLTSPHTGGKLLPLTAAEKATIREVVYGPKLPGVGFDVEIGKDVLVAPDGIKKFYGRTPVFTLYYLAQIVETGRPVDSLAAAIYALEYKHRMGKYLIFAFLVLDDYDKPDKPKTTCRERWHELIREKSSKK